MSTDEAVRFHIDQGEAAHHPELESVYVSPSEPKSTASQQSQEQPQPYIGKEGGYHKEQPEMPMHTESGKSLPDYLAPIIGHIPRDALVTVKTAPALWAITIYLTIVYLIWFGLQVVVVSMQDEATSDLMVERPLLQVLSGPLNSLAQLFSYQYLYEGFFTYLMMGACWAAVVQQTRQVRAIAVFATTWTVFTWLMYTQDVFQGLDAGFKWCDAGISRKWCRVSRANAVLSCLLEAGKIAAWMWAWGVFIRSKGLEPYCELDASDLKRVARRKARTYAENERRTLVKAESMQTVPTVPLGLAQVEVPANHVSRTSLADCQLDPAGRVVLGLCILSTIGFIITMLASIPQQMLGNQLSEDSTVQTATLVPINYGISDALPYLPAYTVTGDLNLNKNESFLAFHLFFAIGLSIAGAYDRVRDTSVSPILLTLIAAFGQLGMFIYSARRVHLCQSGSNYLAFDAQAAMVVGQGITTCCEILRFFALIWKVNSSPAAHDPAPDEKSNGRGWAMCYNILSMLVVLCLLAWTIVLIAIQSAEGLFTYTPPTASAALGGLGLPGTNPRWTYVSGQSTAEDALVFPYQVFITSINITGWMVGISFYTQLRGDRVGNLVGFSTFALQTATWFQLCWTIVYSGAFKEGDMYKIFCRTDAATGEHVFTEDICDEVTAACRLAVVYFIILVLYTLVAFARWATASPDVKLMEHRHLAVAQALRLRQMQAASGVSESGEAVHLPSDEAILLMEEERPAHSRIISFFLFVLVSGWVISACAVADQGQTAFWMPAKVYESVGADIYWFISVHYIGVPLTAVAFIHAHLAVHPTLRHFNYFWRFGQFFSCLLVLALSTTTLIMQGRVINDGFANDTQKTMFGGLVLTWLGTFAELVYCQSLFRRYPLFTTPNQMAAFTKRHTTSQEAILQAHNIELGKR